MKKSLFSLFFAIVTSTGFGQCDPVNDINESFDGWTELGECWKGISNGGMFLVEDNVTFYSFMSPNLSMYLISPEVAEGNYNISFDFSTVSMTGGEVEGVTIQVGTLSDNQNADSFVAITDAMTATLETQALSIPVTIAGNAKFIVIKYSSMTPHSAGSVDNFVLSRAMGVSDVDSVEVSVYPNPVINELNISSASPINQVKIFDLTGSLVQAFKVNSNDIQLNLSSLKQGVYVAQIITAKGIQTVKVIKK